MKKFQNFLIKKAAEVVKKRIDDSDVEETLNLFNSGFIIDLKVLKRKSVEIMEKKLLKKKERR